MGFLGGLCAVLLQFMVLDLMLFLVLKFCFKHFGMFHDFANNIGHCLIILGGVGGGGEMNQHIKPRLGGE